MADIPTTSPHRTAAALLAAMLTATMLGGCNVLKRLSEVGEEPKLSAIEDPTGKRGYEPVSLPMPAPEGVRRSHNSLWRNGARAFFRDHRAKRVGDILTIVVALDDEAALNNSTQNSRAYGDELGFDNFLGFEKVLNKVLPDGAVADDLVDLDSASTYTGSGNLGREEEISLKIAALIVQTLPNGNLVVNGRQEIRVNSEMREVQVAGIIRPEDITSENTIGYEKIAEARIAYGGRGTISDVQTPRYGAQVLDVLLPF